LTSLDTTICQRRHHTAAAVPLMTRCESSTHMNTRCTNNRGGGAALRFIKTGAAHAQHAAWKRGNPVPLFGRGWSKDDSVFAEQNEQFARKQELEGFLRWTPCPSLHTVAVDKHDSRKCEPGARLSTDTLGRPNDNLSILTPSCWPARIVAKEYKHRGRFSFFAAKKHRVAF
jgi:hypothetical protein